MSGAVKPLLGVEFNSLELNIVKDVGFQGSAAGVFYKLPVQVRPWCCNHYPVLTLGHSCT
jgi:hypothetical protein